MEFDRLLSAAADYGFPMLVSSYLLVRMEGRIEKLSANIDTLTRVLQERLVMQFPYVQQKTVYTSKNILKTNHMAQGGCRTQSTAASFYRKGK